MTESDLFCFLDKNWKTIFSILNVSIIKIIFTLNLDLNLTKTLKYTEWKKRIFWISQRRIYIENIIFINISI